MYFTWLFIKPPQLAQRSLNPNLAIKRRITPLIESLDPDDRGVIPTGLNFRFFRNDLETTRRAAAHNDQLLGATNDAVGTDRGAANSIWSGLDADADESERRHLVLVIQTADPDVLIRDLLAVDVQLDQPIQSHACFDLQTGRHRN